MSQWLDRVRARKAIDGDQTEAGKVEQGLEDTPQPSPEPSRWSRLASCGLHHNDVADHVEVIFLFAIELIADPTKAREDCRTLPTMWGYYAPFWKERLSQDAFEELARRYRRQLQDLGLAEEVRPPQGPKPLRPLILTPDGKGCAECGGREYWVSTDRKRYCFGCHPAYYKDAIAIGTIRPAEEEVSRPSMRRRRA